LVAARPGLGVPRINDYTTDLADPPAFTKAASLPANAGRSMAYPPAFAAEQRTCCADLHPVHLTAAPTEAFPRVQAAASGMPAWTVIASEPATGMIEAVATSTVFGFQDDLGVNANRIRAFEARLEHGA